MTYPHAQGVGVHLPDGQHSKATGLAQVVLEQADSSRDTCLAHAGNLYRLLAEDERQRLVEDIARSLARVPCEHVVARCIAYFRSADEEYGARVERCLRARRVRR